MTKKTKMARGGKATTDKTKMMRGGGMAKDAKTKMARGGKATTKMMRGGMTKKKK